MGECNVEDLARDEVFCIAEPSGLGAPYFRGDLGIRFSQPVEHLPQRRIAVLLLEAIIFRVARILEEFHHESAIERLKLPSRNARATTAMDRWSYHRRLYRLWFQVLEASTSKQKWGVDPL